MNNGKIGLKVYIALILSFAISFGIILGVSIPESYDYAVGDIATEDIYATREIEDKVTTTRRKEAAASQVGIQYKINYELNEKMFENLQKALDSVLQARGMELALAGKISFLKEDMDISLSDSELTYLLSLSAEDYGVFSKEVREVFTKVMDSGVVDKEDATEEMKALFLEKVPVNERVNIAGRLFSFFVKVNEEVDVKLTELEKEKAAKLIEPTVYKKNQAIVRRGEVLTDAHISLLSDMGVLKGSAKINIKYAIGIFVFMTAFYSVAAYYISMKSDRRKFTSEKLILACLLPLIMLFIIFLARNITGNYVYLLPLPYVAILMATFVSARLSALINIYLAFGVAIMLRQSEEFIIAMVVFSAFSAVIFKKVKSMSGYAMAMLLTMGSGALCMAMAMLLMGKAPEEIWKCALLGAINGLISSVLTIGTTPVFENIFNIITPFKLNDLGNPEKPLLKRLMFEAPGTYHHCLMVGNLAEAACMKIGANNQLARVAAYYHDIGKLRRPDYFFENQIGENPHDKIDAFDSAEILKSHVNDGIEIARQYRLPKEIQDVIMQHHGTTPTGVFFKKALETNPNANEEEFKYPGPVPESKEAGIVMLADSCEAAVRSLDEKTEESIRAMVTKIIKHRMAEGQLDKCDLSFRELGYIIDAFVAMLGSYFHKRIKYDSKEKKNEA